MKKTTGLVARPMEKSELILVIDYFHSLSNEFLRGMGVDPLKLPDRDFMLKTLSEDYDKPISDKQFFYLVWFFNGRSVGHSNINKITYGKEAFMHLHVWDTTLRKQGLGTQFVKLSIPLYFENFKLERLFCEPYAYNPGPNHTLPKAGFRFLESIETVPGWINFHQKINRYMIDGGSLTLEDLL